MKSRFVIYLMYLTALFWLIFAITWLFRDSDYQYFYAVSGFSYAVVLAILAYYLNKRQRWAWWGAIFLAGINIILTITDQVGWFDLIYFIPSVTLFIMLILVRRDLLVGKTQ